MKLSGATINPPAPASSDPEKDAKKGPEAEDKKATDKPEFGTFKATRCNLVDPYTKVRVNQSRAEQLQLPLSSWMQSQLDEGFLERLD